MSDKPIAEAIQETNFHDSFRKLMADAKNHKFKVFNFKVVDPECRWIIQVRKKYKNLFELAIDKLSLINQSYVYTDHTLWLHWYKDEHDGFKSKLTFSFYPNSETGHNICMMSPDYRFDCDTFFKDLRYALWLDNPDNYQ